VVVTSTGNTVQEEVYRKIAEQKEQMTVFNDWMTLLNGTWTQDDTIYDSMTQIDIIK
jgi:hypothetical protein